jgi:UDP-N-acetyl-D-galactosamine dehydrogenase
VNELALIFQRLEIDTLDVLESAGTKWNVLNLRPGLVGGHCIDVDPDYLTHKAQQVGNYPEVVLAGRRINDGMGRWAASPRTTCSPTPKLRLPLRQPAPAAPSPAACE